MGNAPPSSHSSKDNSSKDASTAAIVSSDKNNNATTNDSNNNAANSNVPPVVCAASTIVSSETIPSPSLKTQHNTVTSPGKRLLDLNELIASKEKETQLLLDQLSQARDKEKEAIEYSELQINEFNEEIEAFYETSRNELTTACDRSLNEIIQSKDNELTEIINTLRTVVFPERLLLAKEDIISRHILNDLPNEWNKRYNHLKNLQATDLELVKSIARQEFEKTGAHVKSLLAKEIQEIEEKHRIEKKKRGSGVLSWLSPSKKYKNVSDDDEDEENNVEN